MKFERADAEHAEREAITVAIACYNQARFLGEALDSVLAQSFPAGQIIVVDDGSTDDTSAVAAKYPQVRYLRRENGGPSAARNTALDAVDCRYVLFLDADDTLDPQTLAWGRAALRADDNLAFVHGGYREIDEVGNLLSTHPAQFHDDIFANLLWRGNYIAMSGTVIYDATRLREAGGFDPTLHGCEDYDVLLRLSRDYPAATYEGIAASYRRHGPSQSTDTLLMIATAHSVTTRHARSRTEMALARRGARRMLDYYAKLFCLEVAGRLRHGEWGMAFRSLRRALRLPVSHGPILRALLKLLLSRAVRPLRR